LADSLRGANWPGSEKARYRIDDEVTTRNTTAYLFGPLRICRYYGFRVFKNNKISNIFRDVSR